MKSRLKITNSGDRAMLVFTEMEAQDYWLLPGESVEVRAEVESSDEVFELEVNPDGVTVFPSVGMGYISTWSEGRLLECGHQRPSGWT